MSDTANIALDDELDQLDLTCPGCGVDLLIDDTYNLWRVCGGCNRHFWISARERAQLLDRFGSFQELPYTEPVIDALDQYERLTAADRQSDARDRTALADAIVTGRATFDSIPAIVAILDPALLPSGVGIVTADKLISAIRSAITDRLPMVIICAGGSLPTGAGLLGAAQSLRMSGAVAELHRSALPLIAVMTHPTGGNLLTGIVTNADIRMTEPGTELPTDLVTDEIVDRTDLDQRIATVLTLFAGGGDTSLTLGSSEPGATAAIRAVRSQALLEIAIDSSAWRGNDHWRLIRRAHRIAMNLELPLLFSITGRDPLELPAQTELRDLLLRHRRPVVGHIFGNATSTHLNLLATDTLFAGADLSIPGARTKLYTAADAKSAGIIDHATDAELLERVGSSIESWGRLSPSRRFELRLRAMDRRGAEVPGTHEATRLELLDLRELQSNFKRSVDDWRRKFDQREFTFPTMASLQQARSNFRPPTIPKMSLPDLSDMRDKWLTRMRANSDRPDIE